MPKIWKRVSEKFVETEVPSTCAARTVSDGDSDVSCFGFRIVTFRNGSRPSYVLIANTDNQMQVNGSCIVGGLHVLRHKDELIVEGEQLWFSSESVPVVEIFAHGDSERRPRCPVCRAEIQDGQSIVRCPGCLRLYHQIGATGDSPEKPCWTYVPECKFCQHPTSMSGEPGWRPDGDAQSQDE